VTWSDGGCDHHFPPTDRSNVVHTEARTIRRNLRAAWITLGPYQGGSTNLAYNPSEHLGLYLWRTSPAMR